MKTFLISLFVFAALPGLALEGDAKEISDLRTKLKNVKQSPEGCTTLNAILPQLENLLSRVRITSKCDKKEASCKALLKEIDEGTKDLRTAQRKKAENC